MPRRVHEHIERELCIRIPGVGRRLDVANIVVPPAQALQTAFAAQRVFDLIDRETVTPHHVQHGHRVEIAHAVVVRQTGLRTQTHAVADRRAVKNTGDRRTAAEMTRHHPKRRAVHRRTGVVDVQVAGAVGHVFAAKQFCRAFRNELVARPVESPTSHPGLVPALRYGIAVRRLRRPLVKGGLKQTHQRHCRHLFREQPNAPDVWRIVRRRDEVAEFHRVDHVRRQFEATGAALGHDGLEAHRRKIRLGGDPATLFKLCQHLLNRLGMVGHPLHATTGQHLTVAACKIKKAVLHRGRPKVGDKNFHVGQASRLAKRLMPATRRVP